MKTGPANNVVCKHSHFTSLPLPPIIHAWAMNTRLEALETKMEWNFHKKKPIYRHEFSRESLAIEQKTTKPKLLLDNLLHTKMNTKKAEEKLSIV